MKSDLITPDDRLRPLSRDWSLVWFCLQCIGGAALVGVMLGLLFLALVVLTEGMR